MCQPSRLCEHCLSKQGARHKTGQVKKRSIVPTYVAMLRGVNVGGNPLKMEWLRGACEEMGLRNVRTYLQSGNIVLASPLGAVNLATSLKRKIDKQTRLPVPVIVRSAKEMADIVAQNPFLKQKGLDATKLHVTFLADAPKQPDIARLDRFAGTRDAYQLAKREIFLYCPINYGETKLSNTAIEKALGVSATTRNWNTVTTLAEMAME
jgi:uncharacterized protein (DUF1697 family)